jgi:hydroxymethylglutaryl-CoA lyase
MAPSQKPEVEIVEVGPRDGLQNEPVFITTDQKLALIDALGACGFHRIEVTAFVSPRWVPQMADHDDVMRRVTRHPGIRYMALTPNEQGAAAALAAGADEVAVFAAASETFSQRNTNCSIAESITRFRPVMTLAEDAGIGVRGYISCCLDCPYEGETAPGAVLDVALRLQAIGCREIVISDTIGRGTPARTMAAIDAVMAQLPARVLAGHFHDTAGRAIDNIAAAWDMGIRVFDGSVGGLGGCPYAPGAAGNVDTCAIVSYFESRGIRTGIDLARLKEVAVVAQSLRAGRVSPH